MNLCPISLAEANEFVNNHHRHHNPVIGHKFSVAVTVGDDVCGVAIVSRPVSRHMDDELTLEVTRCCTDGTKNACSMLYGACWRAVKAMGYKKLITYTLQSESGISLAAAGWHIVGEVKGRSWSCQSRPRVDKHPLQDKFRWEAA